MFFQGCADRVLSILSVAFTAFTDDLPLDGIKIPGSERSRVSCFMDGKVFDVNASVRA